MSEPHYSYAFEQERILDLAIYARAEYKSALKMARYFRINGKQNNSYAYRYWISEAEFWRKRCLGFHRHYGI